RLLKRSNMPDIPLEELDARQRFVPVAPVRVCVVQYQMRLVADFRAFAEQCEHFVSVASEYTCDFLLFPELLTTQVLSLVYDDTPAGAVRSLAELFTTSYLELFTRLAAKYNVNIIGGSHVTIEDDELYNVSYLFRRDGTLGKQYKLHVTPRERHLWG